MPVFNAGNTPQERRRQESRRTLSGQVQSLTFVERANPALAFGSAHGAGPLGLLLNSATASLLFAGVQKRTTPRFQIGSRSGREYQQQIAVSGGTGTIDLVFNGIDPLHRELMAPPLNARYLIRSFTAPPQMSLIAGEYEHISSGAVALPTEEQPTMAVEMLDNFGAEYVPSRLYQLTGINRGANPDEYTFQVFPNLLSGQDENGAPSRDLILASADNSRGNAVVSLASGRDTITVTVDSSGGASDGQISVSSNSTIDNADFATDADADRDILALLHMPGLNGGYAASTNLKATDMAGGFQIADDNELAGRINAAPAPVLYLGFYATKTQDLLFRS